MKKTLLLLLSASLITTLASAQEKSADEIAKELANPNTPLASLTLKTQYRIFDGDLPGAGDQEGTTFLFQPGLPFLLESGDKVIWRPALPIVLEQPVFDATSGTWDDESGIGDLAMDIAYAPKTSPGTLVAVGSILSLPIGSDKLTNDRFTLGPEVLVGKLSSEYILGLFPNHQWDVGGSGDADINLTTIQAFATFLPGGGWNIGSSPIMNYDWEAEQWTIPLQLSAGKTVIMNGRPWKLSGEVNYYVEQPDAFGPDWMISISIAPVVKNFLADLL